MLHYMRWHGETAEKGASMGNFIIIDGNSLINRAFYALPPLTGKTASLLRLFTAL